MIAESRVGVSLSQFCIDEAGQDMVEYALLSALIAITSIAAWRAIELAFGAAYRSYDTAQQNLWEPCDPGASEC